MVKICRSLLSSVATFTLFLLASLAALASNKGMTKVHDFETNFLSGY
ncbi:hypothetical protein QT711_14385 [Sporosarcina saromensis]|uniref:Uncharacterized protein n=1 Tax=Sporosarcina saromensis TaxID=359365 RepID=A0ABU4GFK5_9BACL|nr:hypothetical protein [Sporosarcina saromensis]MDW0114382.1 hypothetical protein [Sporosarcina saromensis]